MKLIDTSQSTAGQPNPYVNVSTANDGIPDIWKQEYFGANVDLLDSNFASADPDGDGMTNYEEFFAGTSPVDPASKLSVTNLSKAGQSLDLSWKSVPGQDYHVIFSPHLVTWQEPWSPGSNPVILTADGTETTMHATLPDSIAGGRMFFKVDLNW